MNAEKTGKHVGQPSYKGTRKMQVRYSSIQAVLPCWGNAGCRAVCRLWKGRGASTWRAEVLGRAGRISWGRRCSFQQTHPRKRGERCCQLHLTIARQRQHQTCLPLALWCSSEVSVTSLFSLSCAVPVWEWDLEQLEPAATAWRDDSIHFFAAKPLQRRVRSEDDMATAIS